MHGILPANPQASIFSEPRSQPEFTDPKNEADISAWSFRKLAWNLWGQKTASHLEFLTGEPAKTHQDRLTYDRDPAASTLVKLLRSSQGFRVLNFIMRGCKEPWWRDHLIAEAHMAARAAYDNELSEQMQQLELRF